MQKASEYNWVYFDALTPKDEENYRVARQKKDGNGWGNLWNDQYRWIGDLGEMYFRQYLESLGHTHGVDFTHNLRSDSKDRSDFDFGRLVIDVKTQACRQELQPYFQCNVNDAQLFSDDSPINTYVFMKYLTEFRTAVIVGWISKEELQRFGKGIAKGQALSGGRVADVSLHCLPIFRLNAPIEIDRFS